MTAAVQTTIHRPMRIRLPRLGATLQPHLTIALYGVALIILSVIAVLAYQNINVARGRAEWVAHTQQVQVQIEELISLNAAARIAWRSFLTTSGTKYANDFETMAKVIPLKIQSLKALTTDNPRQRQRLSRFSLVIDQDLAAMQEGIRHKMAGNLSKPAEVMAQLTSIGVGNDELTKLAAEMKEEEKYLLAQRVAEADATARTSVLITVIGNASSLLILLFAFALFRREAYQRKTVEQALRKSEEHFRSLAQSANDAIISANSKGDIVFWNPGAQAIFGYSEQEILGRPLNCLMPDRYRELHLQGMQRVIDSKEPRVAGKTAELSALRSDGTEFPIELSLAKWESQGEIFFTAMIRDITERKHVEDELRRSEERFRLMVESVTDYAIFMLDTDGRIASWNAGAERINGYSPEEVLGRHFSIFYPPEDIESRKPTRELEVATATGRFEEEGWRVRKNGTLFWATVIITAMRDSAGTLRGFVKVTRDLTERKLSTERIRDSEARLQAFMRNSPSLIFIKDLEGRYLHINEQFTSSFGLESENVIGRTDIEIFEPKFATEAQTSDAAVLTSNSPVNFEHTAQYTDGLHTRLVCKFPIHDSSGRIMALGGIATDISDRKAAEQKIETLNTNLQLHAAELERANQALQIHTTELETTNRELKSFTYTVAHDLRSPIRAIIGFCRLVEEGYQDKLDGNGRRLLKTIYDSGGKMGRLIDDLLSLSQFGQQPLNKVDVDMFLLVQEIVAELQQEIGERSVELIIKPISHAQADRSLIRQVWKNLLSNAVKFTRQRKAAMIEVGEYRRNSEQVYYVTDNGTGFDMRYYDKLFEVFQRLNSDEAFPGTGVGLAIVHKVITRHGGRVWAEGEVDKGASFYFSLSKEIENE